MERRANAVQGLAQGIGLRRSVYRLASQGGWCDVVRHDGGQLRSEVEGETPQLHPFLRKLSFGPARRARVENVPWTPVAGPVKGPFRGAGGPHRDRLSGRARAAEVRHA